MVASDPEKVVQHLGQPSKYTANQLTTKQYHKMFHKKYHKTSPQKYHETSPQNVFAKTGCTVSNKFYDLLQLNGVILYRLIPMFSVKDICYNWLYCLLINQRFYDLPQLNG